MGRTLRTPAGRRAVHGCPRPAAAAPRRLPPSPAREANESAAAAVSCFVAQVRGRAGAAPLHAGFPGTLPLAPLAAPRRCLAPPRLLTKGFRIAIGCPGRPPRHHLAAASPRRQPGASALKRSPGGAAVPARVCGALVGLLCTRAEENPAWSTRHPPPGVPAGLRRGSTGPQRAGACDRARTCPAGTQGAQRSPRPALPQLSLPGLGESKVT